QAGRPGAGPSFRWHAGDPGRLSAGSPGKLMVLALIVGPSGAGKDTLINKAQAALADDPRFVFVRRVVTRKAVVVLEDHHSLDEAAFTVALMRGDFVLSWDAHGLRYGIPASIEADLQAGRVVV